MVSRGGKALLVPCFGSVEFVTCLWIACAVLTLVASHQNFYIPSRYGKRHEPRAVADGLFVSGSRYGRSAVLQRGGKSLPKFVEQEPREGQSFWVTRYGKRSPPDYRSVAPVNRFSAVLDFMDRVHRINLQKDASKGNGFDPLS
ncbi:uncharacterized protein LOC143375397 [Andrena cerasifolii]|uniref:uncharacterized protein LOC143375397 n=1 Tax=Andrena cerasifolii TaxID=2819439 RepID=UPI0040382C48